jgi:hypothetical protein
MREEGTRRARSRAARTDRQEQGEGSEGANEDKRCQARESLEHHSHGNPTASLHSCVSLSLSLLASATTV